MWVITAHRRRPAHPLVRYREPELVLIVVQVGFALLHGARRYGWRAIGVFVLAGLVISNILENLSIQTGFPFGHYHYTGGGKIFEVPWLSARRTLPPAIAWVVGHRAGRRRAPLLSLAEHDRHSGHRGLRETAWDLALDPGASTINQIWIWENGGGFFGVPLVNSWAGRSPCTCLCRSSPSTCVAAAQLMTPTPGQARPQVTCKVSCSMRRQRSPSSPAFTGKRTIVTDAAGAIWRTGDSYETSVLVTIYGMCHRRTRPVPHRPTADHTTRAADAGHSNPAARARPGPPRPASRRRLKRRWVRWGSPSRQGTQCRDLVYSPALGLSPSTPGPHLKPVTRHGCDLPGPAAEQQVNAEVDVHG